MSARTGFRRGRLRRLRLAVAIAIAASLGACGDDAAPPLAPVTSPGVVEVYPSARTTRVPLDGVAWARFDVALDSSTVNDRTVFFKLDTRRVPSEVRWESATNRILIRPLEEPVVARTHTIVLSTGIRAADGTPLARPYEWQFRIVGVRAPLATYPAPGATNESPFASAEWVPTEAAAGDVVYEFYLGADSATVASRALPPKRVTTLPVYLPDVAWEFGSRQWWTVTTINRTLGEQVDGPTFAFDVLPPGVRVDSSSATISQYGHRAFNSSGVCRTTAWLCGPGYVTAARLPLSLLVGRKLAGARIETNSLDSTAIVSVLAADGPFNECLLGYPGPPFPDPGLPTLAVGVRPRALPRRVVLSSALLTAYLERLLRRQEFAGAVFQASRPTDLLTTLSTRIIPFVRVNYYLIPVAEDAPRANAPNGLGAPRTIERPGAAPGSSPPKGRAAAAGNAR